MRLSKKLFILTDIWAKKRFGSAQVHTGWKMLLFVLHSFQERNVSHYQISFCARSPWNKDLSVRNSRRTCVKHQVINSLLCNAALHCLDTEFPYPKTGTNGETSRRLHQWSLLACKGRFGPIHGSMGTVEDWGHIPNRTFFRSRQVSSASFACSCAGRNPPIRPVHRNPVVRVPAPRTSLASKTREKSEINRKPAWSDHPSHFSNISTFKWWKVRPLQSSQVCQGWIYPPNQDIPAFETFQPLVWARWWPGHVHPQLKSSKGSESSESFHCNF